MHSRLRIIARSNEMRLSLAENSRQLRHWFNEMKTNAFGGKSKRRRNAAAKNSLLLYRRAKQKYA